MSVRAYVRSPDKIPVEERDHPNLEIVQGDFTESAKVQDAIQGVDFVVVTAGDKTLSKRSHFMLALVKDIVTGMRAAGVKRLLFQGGGTVRIPGQSLSFVAAWILRPMLALMGWSGSLRDNDAVAAWLVEEAQDVDWTFLCPGMIRDRAAEGALVVSSTLSSPVNFIDLAQFHLDLADSGTHVREFTWVEYQSAGV